jgi:hypothetical protein
VVIFSYLLSYLKMKLDRCRSKTERPREDTIMNIRFLGAYADRYLSGIFVVHWKVIVVATFLLVRKTFVFSPYWIFSTWYMIVLYYGGKMFWEIRVVHRPSMSGMSLKEKINLLLGDFSGLVATLFVISIGFGMSYFLVQFYQHGTFSILGKILMGIYTFILFIFFIGT